MPRNATQTAFRLTPKHLLTAAFIVVALAVTALIIGVFQTLNKPAEQQALPQNTDGSTIEILSPRGANTPTTAGTIPNIPGSTIPAATPYPSAPESAAVTHPPLQAPVETNTPPAAIAAHKEPPPHAAPAALETPVHPIETATAAPTPQAAPTPPTPEKPAANQSKDVMDNLF